MFAEDILAETAIEHVALIGNPNVGKTSLFNALTGLNQRIGNFSGVTVDKKTGQFKLPNKRKLSVTDLPGTYSLFAKSEDERVVLQVLLDEKQAPDLVVVVLDAINLQRSLLLMTQVQDLGFEVLPVLNMVESAEEEGTSVNLDALAEQVGRPILQINARKGKGIKELKQAIQDYEPKGAQSAISYEEEANWIDRLVQLKIAKTDLGAILLATKQAPTDHLTESQLKGLDQVLEGANPNALKLQVDNTAARLGEIHEWLATAISRPAQSKDSLTKRLDRIFLHPVFGFIIFFGIMLGMFQAVFNLADYPMTWIDEGMASLIGWTKATLPSGALNDLLTDGLLAGIGGVLIFVPQIAILFALIAILEESGYMSRAMFIMDKVMRRFGLNGQSVVPLVSGLACAIPAIMAARSIPNAKERMITIFVTPFMSCAARLPVYLIIIALVIPNTTVWGIFGLQGLVLFGLYLLGILAALITAWLASRFVKQTERSIFMMDMPTYKMPRWGNIGLTILQKTKAFVWGAGRIIVAIAMVLWGLASYAPSGAMEEATQEAKAEYEQNPEAENLDNLIAAKQLEASYLGQLGQTIEPVIRPLGYDWKIGIALIASFAAREVFVGTLATIYNVGDAESDKPLMQRLRNEKDPKTGEPKYDLALGLSLLVFYVFAMQCMSTLAIARRETNSWKIPMLQLVFMTGLAYLSALAVYQMLA